MKKIIEWLSGGVIKEIGNVLDNLTTSEEEKLEIKKQVQQILEDADTKAQEQVSSRWASDMQSDSFLSKNIRPMVLIYLTVIFSSLAFFDGNVGEFKNCRGVHTNISNIVSYRLRSIFCWKILGKSKINYKIKKAHG